MHPHAEILALLTTYGYVAVFLGAMFEGEIVVMLSGMFAQQGYLSLPLVILLVQIAAVLNDGMWFLIGRYRVPKKLYEKEWFQKLAKRPMGFINDRPEILALTMRFMYGFRSLIPLGLGLSNLSAPKFFVFHGIGTLAWSLSLCAVGYFFGTMLETLFGRIRYPELLMVAVVVIMVTVFFSLGKIVKRFLGRKLS